MLCQQYRRKAYKSCQHIATGHIRFLKQKGWTDAGFFVLLDYIEANSKAISASIAWHRLRA